MTIIDIQVKRLDHARDLALPKPATEYSAGVDLVAAIENEVDINPSELENIPTGLAVAIPAGFEAQIRPRSGLAAKFGLTILNSPGTIDSDYRGEISVLLFNTSKKKFRVERGMRIAQMIVAPVITISWVEVEKLSQTARGAGGFGSTGTNI